MLNLFMFYEQWTIIMFDTFCLMTLHISIKIYKRFFVHLFLKNVLICYTSSTLKPSSLLFCVSWICSDFSPHPMCPLWCHMLVVFNDVMTPFVWSPPSGLAPAPDSLRCKLRGSWISGHNLMITDPIQQNWDSSGGKPTTRSYNINIILQQSERWMCTWMFADVDFMFSPSSLNCSQVIIAVFSVLLNFIALNNVLREPPRAAGASSLFSHW